MSKYFTQNSDLLHFIVAHLPYNFQELEGKHCCLKERKITLSHQLLKLLQIQASLKWREESLGTPSYMVDQECAA